MEVDDVGVHSPEDVLQTSDFEGCGGSRRSRGRPGPVGGGRFMDPGGEVAGGRTSYGHLPAPSDLIERQVDYATRDPGMNRLRDMKDRRRAQPTTLQHLDCAVTTKHYR